MVKGVSNVGTLFCQPCLEVQQLTTMAIFFTKYAIKKEEKMITIFTKVIIL